MVGSVDYNNAKRLMAVNVALAPPRQPGSALKPIVYAALTMAAGRPPPLYGISSTLTATSR